jgi:hypothetical protein
MGKTYLTLTMNHYPVSLILYFTGSTIKHDERYGEGDRV